MFIFYVHELNRNKIYWEIKNVRKEAESQNDLLRKRIEDIEAYYTKMKLLLLARISDPSKELSFWRNTIRLIKKPGYWYKNINRKDKPEFISVSLAFPQ